MGIQNDFSMFPKPKYKKKKREIVNKETYEKVYERDKRRCRLCGSFNNLQLHHIDGRGVNLTNNVDNCIMLCMNCHLYVVHKNLKKYRPLLKEIINRRNYGN